MIALYGIPNDEAPHIDWSKDTEPPKLSNIKTADEFPNLSPFEREIELYKDKKEI